MEESFASTESSTREGSMTRAIEKQTAKIPSMTYLVLAGGAITLSLILAGTQKNKGWANFIGLWVPSLLLIGIYNKLVKIEGSDKSESYH
jgi:hypothetical protein